MSAGLILPGIWTSSKGPSGGELPVVLSSVVPTRHRIKCRDQVAYMGGLVGCGTVEYEG